GNLRDQTVADRQKYVYLHRLVEGQLVLDHADDQAADDRDDHDQDAGDGVTAHEFARTVHRTVKVCFRSHFFTAGTGLDLNNQAGGKVRVGRHQLTEHGGHGKPGK